MINYIKEHHELEKIVPVLMDRNAWGVDTETTGLDPHVDDLVLLQIGNGVDQFVIDLRYVNPMILSDFFESREIAKVFHNAKFDYKFLKNKYGFDIRRIRDTFLAEKCLHAGVKFSGYGLKKLLEVYFDIPISKEAQTSFKKTGDLTETQLDYAAKDVEYLLPLMSKQQYQIINSGLTDIFVLECDAVPAIADMELSGMALDVKAWSDLIEKNTSLANSCSAKMDTVSSQFFGSDLFGKANINYGSQPQVLKLLHKLGVQVPIYNRETEKTEYVEIEDTSDATLKKIKDNDFVDNLKKYRSCLNRINTFGDSFIEAIHPVTGRIQCLFNQYGTETGRLAKAKDSPINPLNIPRDKAYRNAFIAEQGYTVETDDYAGCELRIWAEISEDKNLIEAFAKGLDVHCFVASKLYGVEVTKDNENKHLRTPAKSLNFGIAYGSGPGRLYEELNAANFPVSHDQARSLYMDYTKNLFPVGVRFLREVGKSAVRNGFVTNMHGRKRSWLIPDPHDTEKYPLGAEDRKYRARISSIEREAGNFVIQSVNADMTKRAMIDIRDYAIKNSVDTQFINQVYDEIVTTTVKSQSADFHPVKQKIMQDASPLKLVPMVVDGEVLPYWTK